ncbi:MAG: metallophosphoesterase [Crocinitomicaceae bacterium]|nr:metallophosphoesterase [Crocinitomicaceae bacterium]
MDNNYAWSVEHRLNEQSEWLKADSISMRRVEVKGIETHRIYTAQLSGLTAGSTFAYRILQDGKQIFSSNAHAIKSKDQSQRFVVMGDIGAETLDQKKLAYQAFLAKPDFVAVPGDIVYEYGLISEYRTKFWPVYNANKMDSLGAPIMRSIPFVTAVGNHDADSRDLDKTPDALAYYMYFSQPLNGLLGKEGGPILPILKGSDINKQAFLNAAGSHYPMMTNFSFDYGNAHWTVIDSNTYMDWTDMTMLNWVTKDLEASKDAKWHFVMFHHPGFNSSREHYEQQQMRLLAPIFEKGKVDIVFNGHVHNYQRSYPITFVPDKKGTLLVGGKDNKTIRGRVVNGKWTLDKKFDGVKNTLPKGVIYIVTGAGGQELYNPEQEKDSDSWQKFTSKFVSTVHTLSIAEINKNVLTVRQIDTNGKVVDKFTLTK